MIDVNKDAAGIDFFADLNFRRFALTAQIAGIDRCHVHQRLRLFIPTAGCAQLQITLVGLLNLLAKPLCRNLNAFQTGFKGCMPAMIRPIGIQNANFRFCRIALLFVAEIVLHQGQIGFAHR